MNNGYFLNYKYVWNIAGDIFIYTKKINRCLSKIQIEPGVLYFIWLPQTKPLGAPVLGPGPAPARTSPWRQVDTPARSFLDLARGACGSAVSCLIRPGLFPVPLAFFPGWGF